MSYKGQHWPTTYINGTQEMHIFLIGDWGGLDGHPGYKSREARVDCL